MPKRNFILLVALAGAAAGAIWFAYSEARRREADVAEVNALREALARMGQYQHRLTPEQRLAITEGALKGMVEALRKVTDDPYCRYVDRDEKQAFEDRINGYEWGLGLRVGENVGELKIAAVVNGSPAYEDGLVPGDVLVTVNGAQVGGMNAADIRGILDNREGAAVELQVRRSEGVSASGKEVFRLKPSRFEVETVEGLWRQPDGGWAFALDEEAGVCYVRVTEFVKRTREQFQAALRKSPSARALVLDLRGNPGGMPQQAAEFVNLFLRNGEMFTIITQKGAQPERKTFSAHDDGTYPSDVRLVVLTDGRTGSAAEIVAGVLRAHRRALLVGGETCGKNRVQSVIPVSEMGLIVMSTGWFCIGAGRGGGGPELAPGRITPDEPVAVGPEDEPELERLRVQARALPGRPAFLPTTLPAGSTIRDELLKHDEPLEAAVRLLKDSRRFDRLLQTECAWLRGND